MLPNNQIPGFFEAQYLEIDLRYKVDFSCCWTFIEAQIDPDI